ncbi:mitochondrial import protein Pam17-domain-containing protein [Abortiporus biennis]|nr:mitochondrial import protein Pam17-domain-containing protein [Abortiporus biennis]
MSSTSLLSNCRPLSRSLACSRRNVALESSSKFRFVNSSRPKSNLASELKPKSLPSQAEKEHLPWGEYLQIRKSKRRWETAVTIPFAIGGFAGGVTYFGNLEMDPTKPIFNVDPMVVFAVASLGCAGVGYLLGPVVGASCWRMTHRRTMHLIEQRERQFHDHLVKNRVDPSAQSATNPVPDYYGEKIGSLHDYRQWLRDQAKFRRKAFLPEDA